ncbi:hypothetical protein Tco_1195769 [Tanacetum coccineum]
MEMSPQFLLMPSKLEGDDVTILSDAVTIFDLKKPIEDSAGDTVKNPKLNVNSTSLASSACSYPIEDPQLKTLTVNRIETPKSKEPKRALEDEFKDLYLKLLVLEVLAHAPIYNAILNKYVERLELGKNGTAFIQGEMPKKIKDLGLFTLPYRLGDSKPFDTLADLGSCVNLIPLYLFKTLNVGILEETENILGLADGTRSYPVRIVKNVEHWKEIHVTWAQLEKKRDKDTTLHDLDGALDLQGMETASRFLSTSSKLEGDDFTILSDDVTVAYLKKLIEDSAG